MKDLLLCVHVVVETFSLEMSRCHLADFVRALCKSACRTCSTIIFAHSTNQIIVFWRSSLPSSLLKGLAKLGNIVAETMFLVMIPGVATLSGKHMFGRKICVREAKLFLTPDKNIFCFPSSKICFRNTCLSHG